MIRDGFASWKVGLAQVCLSRYFELWASFWGLQWVGEKRMHDDYTLGESLRMEGLILPLKD